VQFELPGELRVLRTGAPIRLGGRSVQRLLAALLVDAPGVVERDTLIERLWGGHPPATATAALQVQVGRLRRFPRLRTPVVLSAKTLRGGSLVKPSQSLLDPAN
jgi:DNA-binding SARP family transcriptional activator